jgi:hypothetical protein
MFPKKEKCAQIIGLGVFVWLSRRIHDNDWWCQR